MLEQNRKYGFLRILLGILLIVLLVIGGLMLYRAGFAQGAVSAGQGNLTIPEFTRSLRWNYPYHGHFFFPGGLLLGLLFLFLVLGLFRRAFFAPRWGMHRMHSTKWQEKAEEWHIQLHNRMDKPPVEGDEETPKQTEG